jgi:hypothetical protein
MRGEHMRKQVVAQLLAFITLAHIVLAQTDTVVLAQTNTNFEYKVQYPSNDIDCSDLKKILSIETWKFEITAPQKTMYFPVSLVWYENNKIARVLAKNGIMVAFGEEARKEHKGTLIIALQPLDGGTVVTASKLRLSCSGFNTPNDSSVFDNPFLNSKDRVTTWGSPEQTDNLTFKLLESGDEKHKRDVRIRLDLDAREGKYLKISEQHP